MPKLTIYSFKTYEDLLTLESEYGDMIIDVCRPTFHKGIPFYPHVDKSIDYFKSLVSYSYNTRVVCNDSIVVNYMLNWCDENAWEAEVIYCENEKIKVAPMVNGVLTNWTFGWYYPSGEI